jgi:hypothetical protein
MNRKKKQSVKKKNIKRVPRKKISSRKKPRSRKKHVPRPRKNRSVNKIKSSLRKKKKGGSADVAEMFANDDQKTGNNSTYMDESGLNELYLLGAHVGEDEKALEFGHSSSTMGAPSDVSNLAGSTQFFYHHGNFRSVPDVAVQTGQDAGYSVESVERVDQNGNPQHAPIVNDEYIKMQNIQNDVFGSMPIDEIAYILTGADQAYVGDVVDVGDVIANDNDGYIDVEALKAMAHAMGAVSAVRSARSVNPVSVARSVRSVRAMNDDAFEKCKNSVRSKMVARGSSDAEIGQVVKFMDVVRRQKGAAIAPIGNIPRSTINKLAKSNILFPSSKPLKNGNISDPKIMRVKKFLDAKWISSAKESDKARLNDILKKEVKSLGKEKVKKESKTNAKITNNTINEVLKMVDIKIMQGHKYETMLNEVKRVLRSVIMPTKNKKLFTAKEIDKIVQNTMEQVSKIYIENYQKRANMLIGKVSGGKRKRKRSLKRSPRRNAKRNKSKSKRKAKRSKDRKKSSKKKVRRKKSKSKVRRKSRKRGKK